MKGRRRAIVLAIAVVLAAAGISVAAMVRGGDRGQLVMGEDVPDDLRALATEVFADFEKAFPARLGCIPDVRLVPVWDGLEDRARYLPQAGVIELRVPGTASLLGDSLVHELAHHLEFTCPEQEALRPAFLEAQGHLPGANWRTGATWEETPSEQFAEAVVLVVLGERARNALRMPVGEAAVDLVGDWGRGAG